jgi:hypoxanthine phosphoribosyltransferase
MSKVIVGEKISKLIKRLASKVQDLPQPINLLAVCSGGVALTKEMHKCLKKNKVESKVYYVWTNTINGKCYLRSTDFKKKNYLGTVVIVEDVVWRGHHLPPIKRYVKKLDKKKKHYVAALIDCGKKCDFSIYP